MNNSDRIRKLLVQIYDVEQRLAGLRAELARLVGEKRATVCGVRD